MTNVSGKTSPPAWEFYNIREDPHELHNAINDPQYQSIIKKMKAELRTEKAKAGDNDDKYQQMQEIFKTYWKEN